MADARSGDEIGWYSPDPRAVIPIDGLKVSRSLRQSIRKKIYAIQVNTSFEKVIRSCAEREDTWISEEIVKSYMKLHSLGFAHSVESWKGSELAGGLYGVSLGAAFFGESMFSRARDASKVALFYLVERLKDRGFVLLDTQFVTPHLIKLGAIEISRREYLLKLRRALRKSISFV